jgi:hypothetical protein
MWRAANPITPYPCMLVEPVHSRHPFSFAASLALNDSSSFNFRADEHFLQQKWRGLRFISARILLNSFAQVSHLTIGIVASHADPAGRHALRRWCGVNCLFQCANVRVDVANIRIAIHGRSKLRCIGEASGFVLGKLFFKRQLFSGQLFDAALSFNKLGNLGVT